MALQFVFDYRSPYAFLASSRLPGLAEAVDYFPVDVLAVMRKVHNQPSPECPAKARYSALDAGRWARLYDLPMAPNTALFKALRAGEFDGAWLSRAALAALELGVFHSVHSALFNAVWAGTDDLVSAQGRTAFLRKQGIDADIWALAESPAIREKLTSNDDMAASRGVFGVPSFFVGEELFFGNDRLEHVRAALAAFPSQSVGVQA